MDQAPHPHASQVFNWLLSQRVQEQLSKAVETNERRLDVTPFNAAERLTRPHGRLRAPPGGGAAAPAAAASSLPAS